MRLKGTAKSACGWGRRLFPAIGSAVVCLNARQAWAAAAAPATRLVNVADTRGMSPGISKWIAELYNSNYWLYGLVVVVTMAGMGLLLGTAFDRLMSLVGINLGRLEHNE